MTDWWLNLPDPFRFAADKDANPGCGTLYTMYGDGCGHVLVHIHRWPSQGRMYITHHGYATDGGEIIAEANDRDFDAVSESLRKQVVKYLRATIVRLNNRARSCDDAASYLETLGK